MWALQWRHLSVCTPGSSDVQTETDSTAPLVQDLVQFLTLSSV